MVDSILSNRYFIIALIIALGVVIYMYIQKKSCKLEGMKNFDDTFNGSIERPWGDDEDVHGQYRTVNRKNSKNMNRKKIMDRKDEMYEKYVERQSYGENDKKFRKSYLPKPNDDRPDLSQCQCICQKRRNRDDYDDDNDDN
jgi:preprotein translocase subunit Sec63